MIHDRLLRPAMVGVSKGGPKPEAEPEAVEEEPDGAAKDPPAAHGKPSDDPDEKGDGAGAEEES